MDESRFDLDGFLPYRLNQAAEAVSLTFARVYRERHGMTRTEWRVLAHLGQHGTMSARQVCDRSGLHKTKVSRAVHGLERRGWLHRRSDLDDRRVEHLTLSAAGGRVYAELGALALAHNQHLQTHLTDEEWTVLTRVLAKLTADGQDRAR